MNLIAGIIIGIANDSWIARIVIPFIWGLIFCVYTMILRKERYDNYKKAVEGRKQKWGMRPGLAFLGPSGFSVGFFVNSYILRA